MTIHFITPTYVEGRPDETCPSCGGHDVQGIMSRDGELLWLRCWRCLEVWEPPDASYDWQDVEVE